jgi:asparagine synthase (glutamine-hydrolysing)
MCGITGIAAFGNQRSPGYERLKAMCDTIAHRGPNEEGLHIVDGVAIGMRRLAIIDLAGGSQPIFNEDRSIRVVYNGEIYNFKDLRRSLQRLGHAFQTNTDTEVIVHAYEEYGSAFPKYFKGMFAFALHDANQQKLFLVRDQIGIKPLFYAYSHHYLIWGSEIKAILASRLVDRALDVDALGEFISWEYVPGERTLFREIRKLEAGCMLEVELRSPSCNPRPYWDLPLNSEPPARSEKEWADAVDVKLRESVKRQLVSDVPLGAFLSGGVDSSLVVASMGRAKTFSIGFDDPSYNELKWARKVAAHLEVEHIDDIISPDVVSLFYQLMYYMDDPIGDFSIFPTYLVSRHARKHVTVALSGDGGDELFGGYETYLANSIALRYRQVPDFVRKRIIEPFINSFKPRPKKKGLVNKALRFIEGMGHPEALSHARWRLFVGELARQILFTPEALRKIETPAASHILKLMKRAEDCDQLNRSLYVDLKSYLVDNCLVKLDRMSMAVSLEARVPYLDTEMVELAFQIPGALKISGGKTKELLKEVASRYIPAPCVYRPKEGFSIPIKNWLRTQLLAIMQEFLNTSDIKSQGVFLPAAVERLKKEHLAGAANHSHILWSLIVFQAWQRRWLEGG